MLHSAANAAARTDTAATRSDATTTTSGGNPVTAQSTFSALDSASTATAATWTRTNAHAAEAGYQDPVLGWVSVRAQQDSSGVHATVIPVSQDAAQSLSTHMSSLSSYLAERSTPVDSVTVASPDGSRSGFDFNQSANGQQGQETERQASSYYGGSVSSTSSSASLEPVGSTSTEASVLAGSGVYISVLA